MLFVISPISCKAYSQDDTTAKIEEYRQEIDRSLEGSVDDETSKTLEKYKISADEPSAAARLSISEIISDIWQSFLSSLTGPMKLLGKLIAICAFTVMVKSVAQEGTAGDVYDTAGVLVNILILYETTENAISSIKDSLEGITVFMTTYIPVFSSVLASNANLSSAVGYYSVMFVLCEIISFISANLLLPFSGIVFALSIVSSVNGQLELDGLISTVKGFVKWVLTALMTIFTAVISVKGISGASTDSITSRTIRFAASSFIPIVGGSVSEAYSTIYGSLGVIRSGVGLIGIAAVAVIALRPILL